ncbi:MAG: acyl-ACP--UDP-N-acetylglucosamine O-acyltransferase [Pseudomonadota bacterium]
MREDDPKALAQVDPLSAVDPAAELGQGVRIGPFCCIGPGAVLGDGVVIESHVVIDGATRIGPGSSVGPFTVLGGPPQHLRYQGEPTALEIGRGVVVREQVSIHRGTSFGGGTTRIGDGAVIMAATHIGHDCQIGDGVIVASNATLAGHVTVGNNAFIGGLAGIHQFCRIGARAIVGGCAAVPRDVIPYGSAFGNHARLEGLNVVGMKRAGMSRETIGILQGVAKRLFEDEDGSFAERVEEIADRHKNVAEVLEIVSFLREGAKRPILGMR